MKKTLVTLVSVLGRRKFTLRHAERLLRLPGCAWELSGNGFEFIDGRIRRHTEDNK